MTFWYLCIATRPRVYSCFSAPTPQKADEIYREYKGRDSIVIPISSWAPNALHPFLLQRNIQNTVHIK